MPAIVSDGDHLCLQSRIFLNRVLTQDDHFQGILKIFEIAGIYGPHRIRLQAYLVPTSTKIAGIIGPPRYYFFIVLKFIFSGPAGESTTRVNSIA